jgi:hypothetical protein
MTLPMRIAIRTEGTVLVAYITEQSTMDRAISIGSISRVIARDYPELFERWKELMKAAMTALCQELFGVTPQNWDESPAPERERSGNA